MAAPHGEGAQPNRPRFLARAVLVQLLLATREASVLRGPSIYKYDMWAHLIYGLASSQRSHTIVARSSRASRVRCGVQAAM
jgi:hypothetical protein